MRSWPTSRRRAYTSRLSSIRIRFSTAATATAPPWPPGSSADQFPIPATIRSVLSSAAISSGDI
jgi:hypothetical protein